MLTELSVLLFDLLLALLALLLAELFELGLFLFGVLVFSLVEEALDCCLGLANRCAWALILAHEFEFLLLFEENESLNVFLVLKLAESLVEVLADHVLGRGPWT